MEPQTTGSAMDPTSFLGALAMGLEDAPGVDCRGWSLVRPQMFARGTERVRVGYLAAMVDMVAGNPPWGPVNPTLDIRFQVVTSSPASGRIRLDCRPLRATRTFYWSETLLFADFGEVPFARATCTFRNTQIPGPSPMRYPEPVVELTRPIEDLFPMDRLGAGHFLIEDNDAISNPYARTVQGGAQATIAELVAEDALLEGFDAPHHIVDLDIRYLDKMRVGPLRARASVLPGKGPTAAMVVLLTDSGDGDRPISHTSIVAVPS